MELKSRACSDEQAAALWQRLFAQIAIEAKLEGESGAHAAGLLDAPEDTRQLYESDAALAITLRDVLAQNGIELEPAAAVTPHQLHISLIGDISILLVIGSAPYYVEGSELDGGYVYDAYACCQYQPERDDFLLVGFMLAGELEERMLYTGHAYTATVHPLEQALAQLQALVAEEQAETYAVLDADEDEQQAREEPQLEPAKLQQTIDEHRERIELEVLEGVTSHDQLSAESQQALREFPVLLKSFDRQVAWRKGMFSIPKEDWLAALDEIKRDEAAVSLPGRLIAAYEWFALEWHELSARATEQYMPARTACLAFIQAFRELTEQSGGTLVLEPTRRSDRKVAGHGSPVTEADILAKLAKLRADLEACGLAAEDAEQLQALVDKMEAMLGAGR